MALLPTKPPLTMPPTTPRFLLSSGLAVLLVWLLGVHVFPLYYSDSSLPHMIAESLGSYGETDSHHSSFSGGARPFVVAGGGGGGRTKSGSSSSSSLSSPSDIYFDQAFSLAPARHYNFPELTRQCERTEWLSEGGQLGTIYLQCEGIYLGLTSVISQVKSCFKMALEAGVGVILPNIPLRDADNLLNYNQGNPAADRRFGDWFDVAHLRLVLRQACPQLAVVSPDDLSTAGGDVQVKRVWPIDEHAARYFRERDGYFWAGKPFKDFFDQSLRALLALPGALEDFARGPDGTVPADEVTVIGMRADFELFNLVNDATGHERHLWDELGRALRFRPEPRVIVDEMLRELGGGPFFAVHFRGEADNMWASPEEQIQVDLEALDQAWEMTRSERVFKGYGAARPPVYLACGDANSIQAFVQAGEARGWNITSKYALASNETLQSIAALPFDFQAIVDLGILVKSHFFIGIMGSAFSYTIANLRDVTSRYRGSSFDVADDEGARTHMFPNNDRNGDLTMERYACCL